jgi:hypothetical protein
METVRFSEKLPSTYKSTWHQDPEERHHHPRRRENLKSQIFNEIKERIARRSGLTHMNNMPDIHCGL